MRLVKLIPGGSYRPTWVSSGATPTAISYAIYNGAETLVSSYAGVSSGSGLYYVDARVDSIGLWKGEWLAYVNSNPYRDDEQLSAFPGDADQPGRYITWDDVVNRFAGFADVDSAIKAASHYVSYAEAYLDGKLAAKFATPFSSNNVTAKDLAIDIVQMRALRAQNSEEYKNIRADVNSRIAALLAGDEIMITTSGAQVTLDSALSVSAWSNTSGYHPTFSPVLPDEVLVPSSAYVTAEADDRGLTNL